MSSLCDNARGVAMLFGIFFAMFMVAVVYAIHGTIEALVYREHVQDAADAAAFSAAVVNARGMNLIVLLNMLMAALLAILVALRIGETLCYIGIAICVALAYPTINSSLAYAPTFQSYAKTFRTAFDKLKGPIHNGISVLHRAGKATSVAIPLGANLRVIDLVAARYDAVGLAIPARLTLPVEDDDFSVLCGHAAKLAGYVVMLPLAKAIPDRIEYALADGLKSLAEAGSDWFCGKEGSKKPDMNTSKSKEAGFERLPKLQSKLDCDAAPVGEPDSPEANEKDRLCKIAAYESLVSQPGRNGERRLGERPCPTDCKANPRPSCPPEGFMDCTEEEAQRMDEVAAEQSGKDQVAPFMQRQRAAMKQCAPTAEDGRQNHFGGYEWLEHQITRTYVFNRQTRRWVEDESVTSYSEMSYVRKEPRDRSYPCGSPSGFLSRSYERDNTRFLCEGPVACLEDAAFPGQVPGPCGRPPIPPAGYTTFRERATRVIALVGCAKPLPSTTYETPSVDLNKEMANSGDEKSSSAATSFRLEKSLELGGSDFQLRSVVFAMTGPSNETEKDVRVASWGHVAENQTPQALVDAANLGARMGVAQAEYYFDWSGIDGADEREEWMWNMGWRARMRPFRMNHSSADAPRENDERGFDQEQLELGGEGLTDGPIDKPECGSGAMCQQVQSGLGLVSDWAAP